MGLRARTRLAVEERRAQLVDKAIEVFSALPFDEVSLDEVARELRISKGLLFHYFPSKRDFFAAAVEKVAEALHAEIAKPVSGTREQAVRAGVRAYFGYAKRHETAYRMLMKKGGGVHAVDEILDRTRRRIVERILSEAEAAPRALARVALLGWVAFAETVCLELLERKISAKDAEELIVRALFDLIARIDPKSAAVD